MAVTVSSIVSEDLDAAIDALRPLYALYFGGMGAEDANFTPTYRFAWAL